MSTSSCVTTQAPLGVDAVKLTLICAERGGGSSSESPAMKSFPVISTLNCSRMSSYAPSRSLAAPGNSRGWRFSKPPGRLRA